MLTLHDFSGAVKFHELRQNASAFREKNRKYEEKLFDKNSPYNLKAVGVVLPLRRRRHLGGGNERGSIKSASVLARLGGTPRGL